MGKLTATMKSELSSLSRNLDRHPYAHSVTNPTMKALYRRGMVAWEVRDLSGYGGVWRITEAGRATLAKEGK